MHSFCCCSSVSSVAFSRRRSLTASHRSTSRSDDSTSWSSRSRRTSRDAELHRDPEDHVVVDGNRQRIRPLEHHADRLAQLGEVHVRIVDVLAENANLARGPHAAVALVEPVRAAQERRLAAARGTDQRGDDAVPDVDGDVLQRLEVAVPEVQVPGLDAEVVRGRVGASSEVASHVVERHLAGAGCSEKITLAGPDLDQLANR